MVEWRTWNIAIIQSWRYVASFGSVYPGNKLFPDETCVAGSHNDGVVKGINLMCVNGLFVFNFRKEAELLLWPIYFHAI